MIKIKNVAGIWLNESIEEEYQTFVLSLVTNDFIFYLDEQEQDDNGNTLMYRNNTKRDIVSSNYFASVGLIQELEEIFINNKPCLFMSDNLKKYGALMVEEIY